MATDKINKFDVDETVFTEDNLPSADDVGALPSNGGYALYEGSNNEAKIEARNVPESDANRRVLRVKTSIGRADVKDALLLDDVVDGVRTEYSVFGTHNPPTAEQVGALPLTGGKVSGELDISYTGYAKMPEVNRTDNNEVGILFSHGGIKNGTFGFFDDKPFVRLGDSVLSLDNKYLYGEHNKPTASDVGAVGWLNTLIDNGSIKTWIETQSNSTSTGVTPNVSDMPKTGQYWIVNLDMSSYGNWKVARAVEILSTGAFGQIYWIAYINGNWGEWTTNFLPLTGGTLSGKQIALDSGYATFYGDGYEIDLEALNTRNDNTKKRGLQLRNSDAVSAITHMLRVFDKTADYHNYYIVYGEHNKPTVKYNGNGSTTTRSVNIGGVGDVLYVQGSITCALVTYFGALCWSPTNAKMQTMNAGEVNFRSGTLNMNTSADFFNANGTEYGCKLL